MDHAASRFHRLLRRTGIAGFVLTLLLVFTGCVTNPITGESEFAPFMPSREQLTALGMKAAPQFEQEAGGRLNNPAIQNYVSQVGQRVAAAVPPEYREGYNFSYTVLDDESVNAFALPGGPIYITKGLLYRLDNEAQLAFILAHETAHVIAQHTGRQISKQQEIGLLLAGTQAAIGDGGTSAQLAQAASQLAGQMYLLKHSRGEETEADTGGLRYLVNAGYDPAAAPRVMQILEQAGGSGGVDFLSTHPSPKNRVEEIREQIRKEFPNAVGNPAYKLNREQYQQIVLRQRAGTISPAPFTPPQRAAPPPPGMIIGRDPE